MEDTIKEIILKALSEVYGKEFVELVDGNIYVTDEEINAACEITLRYAE